MGTPSVVRGPDPPVGAGEGQRGDHRGGQQGYSRPGAAQAPLKSEQDGHEGEPAVAHLGSRYSAGWGPTGKLRPEGQGRRQEPPPARPSPHPAGEELEPREGRPRARGGGREGSLHTHDEGQQRQQQEGVEGQQGLEEEEIGEHAGAELAPNPLQGVAPWPQGVQPPEQPEPQVVQGLRRRWKGRTCGKGASVGAAGWGRASPAGAPCPGLEEQGAEGRCRREARECRAPERG